MKILSSLTELNFKKAESCLGDVSGDFLNMVIDPSYSE